MDADRVTIALAGIRNHGETILQAITRSDTLELVALCDVDAQAREETCTAYGIKGFASYAGLLEDPGIEAVALATPNHLHHGQIMQALKRGKHVFVEKPVANTISEAIECIEKAQAEKKILMVGHNTRRRSVFREARNILRSGAMGAIIAVEANLSRHAGVESNVPAWKLDPEKCTLLPMTQLGIHFVDVTHFLFGPVERVYCRGWNTATPNGTIDSTIALLGGTGIPTVALSSYYVSHDTYFYKIYGTNGTLLCEPAEIQLRVGGDFYTQEYSDEGLGSFVSEMTEFGECIRTNTKPETAGEEGLNALAVVEAMRESIRTEATVDVASLMLKANA